MNTRVISVIVPVCNEAGTLERLYRELVAVFRDTIYTPELIFVDDGSTDASSDIIARLSTEDDRVKCIQFSRNFGKEAATSAGLRYAHGDAALMIDADLQHPPSLILELLGEWEAGAEVVVGVRRPRTTESLFRKIGSHLFASTMNTIGDSYAPHGSTDFRLLDAVVVKAFSALTEHGRMTRALIDWLGFRRAYVYFDAAERIGGPARYRYGGLVRLAMSTVIAHSRLPLRLAGFLGLFIIFLAGCLGVFVIVEQFILGDPLRVEVSGTAMLAIMILFLNGIVLTSLGLISLYIGTIHEEVMRRPLFVVRRTTNIEK